jgi:hypothetical protein
VDLPDYSAGTRDADFASNTRTADELHPRLLPRPAGGSKDYQRSAIAAAVLSGQLFAEIRSRRNLTYAVDAPFVERAIASGGLYVTTVSPDTTLALMRQQITALQQGTIDREALERLVQQFITEYFLNNETNARTGELPRARSLYRATFRVADLFVDELRDVTPGGRATRRASVHARTSGSPMSATRRGCRRARFAVYLSCATSGSRWHLLALRAASTRLTSSSDAADGAERPSVWYSRFRMPPRGAFDCDRRPRTPSRARRTPRPAS